MEPKSERSGFKVQLFQFTTSPVRTVSTAAKVDRQKAGSRSTARQERIHESQMVQGRFPGSRRLHSKRLKEIARAFRAT